MFGVKRNAPVEGAMNVPPHSWLNEASSTRTVWFVDPR